MNGRIYDPQLGRFLSADPVIDGPLSVQGYNRYSYVHNNPLKFVDPTGYTTGILNFNKTTMRTATQGTRGGTARGNAVGVGKKVASDISFTGRVMTSSGNGGLSPSGMPYTSSNNPSPISQETHEQIVSGWDQTDQKIDEVSYTLAGGDEKGIEGGETLATAVEVATLAGGLLKAAGKFLDDAVEGLARLTDETVQPQLLDEPTETLYHGGNLREGNVDNRSVLDTTTERAHAEAYAEKSGGEVTSFEVKKKDLLEGELNGTIDPLGKDILVDESGDVVSEGDIRRFYDPEMLNNYKKD